MDRVLGPRAELDFSAYIAERTRHFTGREWIVAAIERWRADPEAPRTFLLTGEPGVGKTAFAAHLVRDRPAWLTAWHFCSATRGGWIDPIECARSLAQQLAVRCPAFREALIRREGERIRGEVSIGTQHGGLAVGVLIERFEAAGVEDAFNRLVRAPLWELEAAGQGSDLMLLIDGLDESLAYSGPVGITDLLARATDLPRFVRWILTSRDERRVLRLWEGVPHLRIHAEGDQNMADIRRFVGQRLEEVLGEDGVRPGDGVVDRVAAKSAGNFLYVSHLMETLARQPAALEELDGLPAGLDGVYRSFLSHRDIGRDPVRWETRYLPVLAVLAVAREPLSEERIATLAKRSRQTVAGALRDLWQYLSVEPGEEQRVRIYHRSFIDFLLDRIRARDFWIDAREAHRRMVAGLDPRRPDGYALRHLADHLAEAGLEEVLFDLVDDPDWARCKLELDPSGRALAADVEIALKTAGRQGRQGVARLIACSLLYAALAERVSSIPSEVLVALVKLGEVQRALDMAGLIDSAAKRALALGAIARALAARGARTEALEIWRQAAAAADSVGNARYAADSYLALARILVESSEMGQATEVLRRAERAIERLEVQGSFASRIELAVLWEAAGKTAASDAVFDRACQEAETVRRVSVYVNRTFDHEPDFGWEERTGDLSHELLQAAVPALFRLTRPEVRARRRERLRQILETAERAPANWIFEGLGDLKKALQADDTQEAVGPGPAAESDLLLPPEYVEGLRVVAGEYRVPSDLKWSATSLAATTVPEAERWAAIRARATARAVHSHEAGTHVLPDWKVIVLTTCAIALARTESSAEAHGCLEEAEEVIATKEGSTSHGAVLRAHVAEAWYEVGEHARALKLLAQTIPSERQSIWEHHRDIAVATLWSRRSADSALKICADQPSAKAGSPEVRISGSWESALESARRIQRNNEQADRLVLLARRAAEEAPADRVESLLDEILRCAETLWARADRGRVQSAVGLAFHRQGAFARAWEVTGRIEHNDLRVDTLCELLLRSRATGNREAVIQLAPASRELLDGLWAAAEKIRGWASLASALTWAALAEQAQDLLEQAAGLATTILQEDSANSEPLVEALIRLIAEDSAKEALDILALIAPTLGEDRRWIFEALSEAVLDAGDERAYRRLVALDPSGPPLVESYTSTSEEEALRRVRTAFGAARFEGTTAVWSHIEALADLLQALDPEIASRLEARVDAVEEVVAALRSA